MNKYGRFVTFKTQPGKADELADILAHASAATLQLESCQQYSISKNTDEPDCIHVFEIWDSKDEADTSLDNPEAKALIAKALPLLAGQPERIELEILNSSPNA